MLVLSVDQLFSPYSFHHVYQAPIYIKAQLLELLRRRFVYVKGAIFVFWDIAGHTILIEEHFKKVVCSRL